MTRRLADRALRDPALYLALLLILTVVYFSWSTEFFGTFDNYRSVAAGAAVVGIVAMGVTVALAAGAIDFSIAGTMALSGVLVAWLGTRVPDVVAVAGALAAAVLVGLFNAVATTRFHVNAFIATLAVAGVLRGLAFLVAGSSAGVLIEGGPVPALGQNQVAGIPITVLVLAVIAVGCAALLGSTTTGRAMLASGGNPEAARLAGLGVARLQTLGYVCSSLAAGIAGVLLAGRTGSGLPQAATGQELLIFSAVILGGTSLWGGRATILGSLLGVFFVETLRNGLVLERVSPYWQTILQGAFLILAVWLVDQQRAGRDAVWAVSRGGALLRRRRPRQPVA